MGSKAAYSGRCGHLILFDVGGNSVLMWAAFVVLPESLPTWRNALHAFENPLRAD
jgi:hypothetical protein